MGEVDKPFGCPQPGCGMKFTNEDHLTVHRKRHEMQLTVNGENQTPLVKHGFIIDQTPTPTRFLRQCDEVGLFQEISLNPFDEQFRRASLLRSHHSITESIGGNGESLETPRVLPPVDSDETISSTSRDDLAITAAATASLTTSITSSLHPHTTLTRQPSVRLPEVERELEKVGCYQKLSLNVSSAAEAGQQTTNVISTPTPVITAGPSVTQSLGVVDVGVAGGVRVGGVTQVTPQQPAPNSVPPSPSATVLQLLLRLPNGQAIPVEIPATPVVSSSSTSTTSSTTSMATSLANPVDCRSPQQSLAKMKLKQALASSSTAARPGCSKTSRANTADRIAEMTRSRNFSGTSSTEGEGEEDSSQGAGLTGKGERRRRHSSDNEDPVEKRKRFLERNRAAAIRCREKKKKWIENLSVKYDELGSINQKLQSEVSSLRSEVAALKSMLLKHKDCPVTLAMQGDGFLDCDTSTSALTPLPTVLGPLPEEVTLPGSAHKPRVRSLSLPAIPSSQASPMEPLPVNLSSTTSSGPLTISSSTKVGVFPVCGVGGASMSPKSINMVPQQPAPTTPTTTHLPHPSTILKVTHGPVSRNNHTLTPQQPQLLLPVSAAQMGKITVMSAPEMITSEVSHKTLLVGGAPNVIVAASQAPSLTQPQLLNLTLHHAPPSKGCPVFRKTS